MIELIEPKTVAEAAKLLVKFDKTSFGIDNTKKYLYKNPRWLSEESSKETKEPQNSRAQKRSIK